MGLVTSAMAASFLSLAFYSSDVDCGVFGAIIFLSAICEFGLAAVARSQEGGGSAFPGTH
jgi:hypothetical protein